MLSKQITGKFTDDMMHIVAETRNKLPPGAPSTIDMFSKKLGCFRKMTDPALEFLQIVCSFLGLDARIQHSVGVMKRNLLKV